MHIFLMALRLVLEGLPPDARAPAATATVWQNDGGAVKRI
jgi:hypothetical protein